MIAVISLLGTISVYLLGKKIYAQQRKFYLSPLLIVPLVTILVLLVSGASYADYEAGAQWLTKLLGPATVAMAVPLYKNLQLLKKNTKAIFAGIFAGCLLAITTSVIFSALLGFNWQTVLSIAPRSVTTPIAMNISGMIGGNGTLTAVFVIITGLIGIVVGPFLIKALKLRSSVSKGIVLGMGAHGCGISKALEFGSEEGTIASLSMIIMAGFTLVWAPLIVPVLQHLIGL